MPEGPAALIGLWMAAEDRLHPLVLAQPEIYERYLRLVRIIADELRSARTPEHLAEAYARAPEIVDAAIVRGGIATGGMDLQLATGAAFAVRYREVLAEIRSDEAARRVSAAKERGDGWVVVYEDGGAGGRGLPPYHRLEMHLPDGRGLHAFAELDGEMARPVYGVEAVRLDPETGSGLVGAEAPSEALTFDEPGPWEAAVEELRARLGEPSA